MLKPELIKSVAKQVGISQADAERAINFTFQMICGAVKEDGRFMLADFGIFKKVLRKATDRPNPQDRSKRVQTSARNTVTFKPSPALKELMNK